MAGRPPKPAAVIKAEKKSHRTKAELETRESAESGLLSKKKLQERKEVKSNKIAHAEFRRVSVLMKAIGKDDALYSSGINTYCLLYAEIGELQEQIRTLDETAGILRDAFEQIKSEPGNSIDVGEIIRFETAFTRLVSQRLNISTMIDKKRKMMLDIDKENVMTISAALRSIPKQPDKKENPLLKALSGEDDE